MAYTVEQVQEILDRKKRKEAEKKQREAAQKQTAQANSAGGRTAMAATTPQQTAGVRYQTGTGSAKAKQSAARAAVNEETRKKSLEAYQNAKNSDQSEQDARADWLGAGNSGQSGQDAWADWLEAVNDDLNPALLVRGKTLYSVEDVQAVLERKQAAQQAGKGTGLAGALAKSYEPYEQKDAFDRINAWYDEGDNRKLADEVRRVDGKNGAYTDADLIKAGWSRQQIDTARQMNAEYDAIPLAGQVLRRTTNALFGGTDVVASAPILAVETGVQAVKNAAQRTSFESGLTEREKKLYDAIRRVDGTGGMYTDRDLVLNGYGAEEILQMRRRMAQLEADDALDTSTSVGYQLYSRGQRLTGAAQSGLTDTQKFLLGAATSAGENLLVAAVNPAAVLPVLSAQGAGEALGQSAEKGESAGKALLGGAAKFGAGWAINSVGSADLARTMGSDYAKDTLAGQIADAVRSIAGDSAFARQYPAIANAITGGVDNAVQAFAETYADMAIDAALGDAEAAKSLFTKETLQSALVSAASGGLSGAAGGAVGTGIGKVRQNMQQAAGVQAADGGSWAEAARRWDAETRAERAAAQTGETMEEQAAQETPQTAQETPQTAREAAESVDESAESVGESAESVDGRAESVGESAESVDGRAESVGESAEKISENVSEKAAGKPAEYRADLGQMDTEGMTDEQRSMAETIASELRMSTGAAEAAILSKPAGVGKDIYLMGANGVYRMAASGGAGSFAEAVKYSGAAAAQVAAVAGGTEALQRMYDWGKADYARANSSPYSTPGLAGSRAGSVTKSRESRREMDGAEGAVVQLSALAHDNEVVLKKTLAKNANACIETALGRVYLADRADAVTALIHEQMHDANAWDPEGGKLLADTAIRYLAQSRGMESVNGMIEAKVRAYEEAGQSLTWEQAAEELVNDGMAGIFATKESFAEWARHEAELAKRTAKAKGTWEAVKQTVNDLLDRVIAAAEELLTREPNSREAQAMKALAEDQKEVLRQLSYEHSERAAQAKAEAGANKNADSGTETAEQAEVKYQIDPEYADEIAQWDREGRPDGARFILGSTGDVLQGLGARENDIYLNGDKVRRILQEHPEMTLEEIKRIPEVLDDPVMVLASRNKNRGKGQNTRLVLFGSVKARDGRPVLCVMDLRPVENGMAIENMQKLNSAYTKDVEPVAFVRNSEVLYVSENKKRTTALLRSIGFKMPTELQPCGSIGSITYSERNVKLEGVDFTELEKTDAGNLTKKESSLTTVFKTEQGENAPKLLSNNSIAQPEGESKGIEEEIRYQLENGAEDADEAGRVTAWEMAAAAEDMAALREYFDLGGRSRGQVTEQSLDTLTKRYLRMTASKADGSIIKERLRAAFDSMGQMKNPDFNAMRVVLEDIAEELMNASERRDASLWDEHPDWHGFSAYVEKGSAEYNDLCYAYGSWGAATKELRRHGVTLTSTKSARGGVRLALDQMYKEAASGAPGVFDPELTGAIAITDRLAEVHDSIKPSYRNDYAESWEEARAELAAQIFADWFKLPKKSGAQQIADAHAQQLRAVQDAANEAIFAERARADEAVKAVMSAENVNMAALEAREAELTGRFEAEIENIRQEAKRRTLENQEQMRLEYDRRLRAQREAQQGLVQEAKDKYREQARQGVKDERARYDKRLRYQKESYQKQLERIRESRERRLKQQQETNQKQLKRAREGYLSRLEYQQSVYRGQLKRAREGYLSRLEYQQAVYRGQLKRARDAREADVMRRNIRAARSTLDKWLTHPTEKNHVSKPLLQTAIQAADLANTYISMNEDRRGKLKDVLGQLSLNVENVTKDESLTAGADWEKAGLRGRIQELSDDLIAEDAALAAEKGGGEDSGLRGLARLDNYQLACLQDILNITIQGIRNENKTVSGQYTKKISELAAQAAEEVNAAKGNDGGGLFEGLRKAANLYQTSMLDARRMLRRLGGYRTGGAMEQLADILEAGQTQKLRIEQEGEALFADVTGAENAKQAKRFAGRNAERVDLGFVDQAGNPVRLNHAQMCSLYMLMQNKDSVYHLMNGGFVVPDAARYDRGDIDGAYQHSRTVVFSKMPAAGAFAGKTEQYVLDKLKDALDDYDKKWIADMQKFYGEYTTAKLNEASLAMFGFEVAKVQNYYPISVDQAQLIEDIEGLKKDGTILGRGMTKERVKSEKPILLEECQNVVNRSLRDTADYAGLAPAIRDVNRILNGQVENREGVTGTLKKKVIREKWGEPAVEFLDNLLTDLQTKRKGGDNKLVKELAGALRSGYAGAVLTLNPSVALSQAASLPTAAAVLGTGATMKAAGQFMKIISPTQAVGELVRKFVKNVPPSELAKIEAEIDRYSPLMYQRLKGSGKAELSGIGQRRTMVQAMGERVPKALTGWITKVDEITVASLWEGAKAYTESHRETLGLAQGDVTSGDYWNAVADVFNRTVEQTQPNYTVLQRNGLQRSPGEMTKSLTMFSTQRFQNYGILADAVGDYRAQAERYRENPSAGNKAEVKRAGAQLGRAVASQAVQTAVFCLMKIMADLILHKFERERDENGDVTAKSTGKRFAYLYAQSALGMFYGGSELFSLCENLVNGTDYEVISPGGLSVLNDAMTQLVYFGGELFKDTEDMDAKKLEAHHRALLEKGIRLSTTLVQGLGVPAGNARTNINALYAWYADIRKAVAGGGFTLSGAPKSAASQYDRLYEAVQAGDAQEAKAALEKLDLLEREGRLEEAHKKALSALKTRLKEEDEDLEAAVQARLAGDDERRQEAQRALLEKLYTAFGVDRRRGADSARKAELIDLVQAATSEQVNKALAGEGARATERLEAAVLEWDTGAAQKELETLLRAGRSTASVKSAITAAAKPEYLAGTADDRKAVQRMLLELTDAEGKKLYTAKEIRSWKENAEKQADEWEAWR